MSAGGVFKLIANDGKADRLIMATELLNQRLKDIMCMRAKSGFQDPTPTLVDIERTHLLFVNAHFKPFVAIAYEYNKVRSQAGAANFGSSVTFSIPQFGDFFSDMVVNTVLDATSATVGVVPPLPPFVAPTFQSLTTTQSSSGLSVPTAGPVPGVFTQYVHEYVDMSGDLLTVGANATNYVRYAEYVGERLFKRVKFDVNGNPLDEYTSEAVMFHRKFRIAPGKLLGWKRLVGQEVPHDAYTDLLTTIGESVFPAAATGLTDVTGAAVPGGVIASVVTTRQLVKIVDGPQTPKLIQPELDLWIPLIFWFNKDSRLSIASVSIPYGQRFIEVDIESQANILFVAPGNLFLRFSVEQQISADATGGLPTAIEVTTVNKWVTKTPTLANNSVINTTQQIRNIDLYINNIFVNPEVHDIYIRRIGFSLIRVHRFQSDRQSTSTNNVLLSNLKWPIETIYLGLRPSINISAANPNQYRDWHHMTALTDRIISCKSSSESEFVTDPTVAFNAAGVDNHFNSSEIVDKRILYPEVTKTIDTLQLTAHGIDIFKTSKAAFFSDYMPYTFGSTNVVVPKDEGAMMLNMCLYPGTYQPSGHINVSRAREFYLQFTSSYVSPSAQADLLVMAVALNFLLISDGSAVLRYST